ncbi:AcrR family transcriptional regulator [Kineosphaera limosa]|uniref:Putative TetR family transcriptional regulator n=1 Tax=Kineosphaera limosa NBRC 100340 TaxID=1184609 RepID=K6VFE4_9MICO|nr:TetR/AcrR family transcriptional regulator [Kineosphaera limosa]NYE00901.1 AcrR family transcriptional regulator [Kineosphaera limosa]GAB94903.1 putative TetR family transcriptional regulator [Kineosphaera limosa NBRC 100340]
MSTNRTAADAEGADPAEPAVAPAEPGEGTAAGQRVVELLWDPPAPSARGRRPKITLDEVLDAAMALADEEGFEALSMRALARRLGVGAMSLYTYVPGRDELFELMIDRAYAARTRSQASQGWRQRYIHHAEQALAMYRRHPWLVHANLWRLPPGPRVLTISDDLLAVGRDAHLPLGEAARVSELLESYIFGIARGEIADAAQASRTGESADEHWAARASVWERYFDPARFPSLFATWNSGFYDRAHDDQADLHFALDLILDSVERLVASTEV